MTISQSEAAQLVLRICEGYKPTSEEQRLLSEIVSLDLRKKSIESLEGFRYLPDLRSLDLSNTQVCSLDCLSGLTNLQSLDLWGTQITSLEALGSLTNLRELTLGWTQITSLEALSRLTNLRFLSLNHTQVDSLSGLSRLTKLQSLDLSDTQISSLKGLSSLTNLKKLYIVGTSLDRIPKWLVDKNLPFITGEYWGSEPGVYMKYVRLSDQPVELFSKSREEIEAYYEKEEQEPFEEITEDGYILMPELCADVPPDKLRSENYKSYVRCKVKYELLPEWIIQRLIDACFERTNCTQRWSKGFCIDELDFFGLFAVCQVKDAAVLTIGVYQVRDEETADPQILLRSILKKLKKINDELGLNATTWVCSDDL